jgi:LDH2 family malate/lactate/ureidoglycolate dehydrogenase
VIREDAPHKEKSMESPTEAMTRIDHKKIRRLLVASFEKFGVPRSDAEIAANGLVMPISAAWTRMESSGLTPIVGT